MEAGPTLLQRRDSPKCKVAGSQGRGQQAVLSRKQQTGERRAMEGQQQLLGQGTCP
jgi:hypothetical protein